MTYNFDPDRWYENQRRMLDGRRDRGEISATDYDAELERLEARYDDLTRRLDAGFEVPRKGPPPSAS